MSDPVYTINDLPRFSPWPARLLGLQPWQNRHKTPQEITREYEHDTYGPLLRRALEAANPVSVEQIDAWWLPSDPCLVSVGSAFQSMQPTTARQQYLDLIESTLQRYLPVTALVELGCGYAGVLLRLARASAFHGLPLYGGEFTSAGVRLALLLAEHQKTPVTVTSFDFTQATRTDLLVPPNALIFTSYATHYVPNMPPDFVRTIASWRPRAVVHFEPFFEHNDANTLLGMMRRRYIEVNDYNRDFLTVLHAQQRAGQIEILDERPAVFGANALLPASIVVWKAA
jgi:hypothetical protein